MSGRQREGQLLHDRRAAVVECLAGNGDRPQLLVFGSRSDQRGEVLETFALPAFACHRAFEGQLLDDRIENEIRPRVVGPRVFAVEFLYESLATFFVAQPLKVSSVLRSETPPSSVSRSSAENSLLPITSPMDSTPLVSSA